MPICKNDYNKNLAGQRECGQCSERRDCIDITIAKRRGVIAYET